MSISEITNIIQLIGFPIVMCGVMGWFVYFMYTQNKKDVQTLTQAHAEETEQLRTAIENNTLVMQKLIDKLDKESE